MRRAPLLPPGDSDRGGDAGVHLIHRAAFDPFLLHLGLCQGGCQAEDGKQGVAVLGLAGAGEYQGQLEVEGRRLAGFDTDHDPVPAELAEGLGQVVEALAYLS